MARRTITELIAQANASLPDNTAAAIEPADVRGCVVDTLDTITPMYGGLRTSSVALNLTTTPQVVPFAEVITSFPPEWVVNAAAGTIARQLTSVAAMTSKLFLNGTIEAPQGSEVVIQIYKNNAPLPGMQTEETGEGPTKSVGFHFVSIDYGTTDAIYKLMVSTPTGTAAVTLRNVQFIGENIPVREVPAAGREL
jgi:hypothetical protein